MKPTIIYVSGAPGSGKTTLAKILSEQLYLPHISSDLVHGSIAFSQPDHDRPQVINEVFVPYLVSMAQLGMSFVVDHVLQYDIAKETVIDMLKEHANVLLVHTQSSQPIERYVDRITNSTTPSVVSRKAMLLERAVSHSNNLHKTAVPADLGIPVITVVTDNEYLPSIDEVVEFITEYRT